MPPSISNRLLSCLSDDVAKIVNSQCTAIPLPLRTVLYEPEHTPKFAYFITSGIASVVAPMPDGETAEVEIIGREGLVGSFHLLGRALVPTSCFMQISGTGLRIEMASLQTLFRTSDEVRTRILELVQQEALTVSQLSGCNRLHEAEGRLARWLLMAQDRMQVDVLHLTQEFLSQMLGTQRTTVTIMAGALQRRGLIQYRQGEVRITDRDGLEAVACDCYPVVKRLFAALYTSRWE